jgi:hypothetical protein
MGWVVPFQHCAQQPLPAFKMAPVTKYIEISLIVKLSKLSQILNAGAWQSVVQHIFHVFH